MAITKEDILEAVGSLTVMELNDLVKAFEENSVFLLLLLQLQVLLVPVLPMLKKNRI
ncbi:50S ribosomal protein L7/L12 [Neisseria gonorrhoeae]|uniref:50S ribosomal protein L7/L12 n=1 Tax=Neisseria gonorrhoeae TaxID=485 RepID=A0A379B1D4_NEIGO|nr:50S ribosomal protein L7/L12 [Neisseria gonorrhoeae]